MLFSREKFQVQIVNIYDGKNSFVQDRNCIIYLWGIYEFQSQNFDQIESDKFFLKLSQDESFSFIKKITQNQTNNNQGLSQDSFAQIDGIEFVLTDSLTQQKMVSPGRGWYCQHVTCFDIQSYLKLLSSSQHVKQYCPICGLPLSGVVFDCLQEQICLQNMSQRTTIQIDDISNIGSLEQLI